MFKINENEWLNPYHMTMTGRFKLQEFLYQAKQARCTHVIIEKTKRTEVPLADLIRQLDARPPQKITGTGIYLTSQREYAPAALLHTLKHFRVMHERVVIMSIHTDDEPRVRMEDALTIEQLSPSFWRMDVRCGFMEQPNIPKVLAASRKLGWKFDIMQTSFMLSRRSIKVASNSSMPRWRDHLFIGMASNAFDATEYFRIPKRARRGGWHPSWNLGSS